MTPLSVPPLPFFEGLAHAFVCEKAKPVPELLPLLRSGVVAVTVAVFGYPPVALGVATTVAVALEPLAIVPRLQVIGAVPAQAPWLGVAETNVRPPASVSVSVTAVADDGPL